MTRKNNLKKKIVKEIKYDMLQKEGTIVSQCQRLRLLRSMLLQSFQHDKLDSSKRLLTSKTNFLSTKNYLLNSLWL